jgi:hypothetical protein
LRKHKNKKLYSRKAKHKKSSVYNGGFFLPAALQSPVPPGESITKPVERSLPR